jgi:hypothetical protein
MVTPGVYKHYKGNFYRVLFVAKNSANDADPRDENVVVYVALYDDGRVCVRPEREFLDVVTDAHGRVTARFFRQNGVK